MSREHILQIELGKVLYQPKRMEARSHLLGGIEFICLEVSNSYSADRSRSVNITRMITMLPASAKCLANSVLRKHQNFHSILYGIDGSARR